MQTDAQPTIRVLEEISTSRRMAGATITAILFFVIFFGIIFNVPEPETSSSFLTALILLFVASFGGSILAGMLVLFTGRKRASITPVLAISENSTYWDTPEGSFILFWNFGFVFGSLIKSFARKSKFLLSEEGVVFYRITGPTLVRWKNIKAYRTDPSNKLFQLKRGRGNWLTLVCTQHYEEANKILSNHLNME